MELLLFEPRQLRGLVVAEFAYELFRPIGGLFYGILQFVVFVSELVPVPVLGISILEHPSSAFGFFLQDHSYALGRLGHVRDFVEMAGRFSILNQHELG